MTQKRKSISERVEYWIDTQHGSSGWQQKLISLVYKILDEEKWESYCGGCDKPHNSFWKTVATSKEWERWLDDSEARVDWDVLESQECGQISPEHFKAFIEFIKKKQ